MIAILLLTTIPHETVATTTVDLVEVNHFYDEQGRRVFEQAIYWDFDGRHNVRGWRLIKHPSQRPHLHRGWYESVWMDGEMLRRVRAKTARETWTQYDPELEDRKTFSRALRRGIK